MAWEIFTRKVRRSGTPAITFNKLGRISLNKTATATLEKDAVEFVLLLWDADKRQVGVRPIKKKDQRAYRLAYGKKGNGAGFSAKTFMDHIDYDYSESRSTPVRWDDGESMFIAELPTEFIRKNPQQTLLTVEPQVGRRAK
ncbi:MAG: hypothetical protein LAO30_12995 [Acidobacteriia bacterium]|nr:hypothetical protein [Terriglobia bacterium]